MSRLERRFRRTRERASPQSGFVIFEATKDRVMHEHFGPSSEFGLDDIEVVLDISTEPLTQELADRLISEGFPRGPAILALRQNGRYCRARSSVFYSLD